MYRIERRKKDKGGYACRCGWHTLPKGEFSSLILKIYLLILGKNVMGKVVLLRVVQ